MKLIVLAIVSIAVFRASCRERPNGRDLNDDGLNPFYGSTLPDDRDFTDDDDLDYGSDLPSRYKDETSTIDPNTISSGPAELVPSTDLDMSFPPLEFGLGDLQDGFQDGTVRSERKSRVSSKCKPDGVCTLLGGTCISNTTHCSGRVVPSLCGGGKCRCCFTVNMEVKMNDLETEFRSMVVNITAANSNLNTKLDSIMYYIMSANSNQSNVNSKMDLKIDSIMSTNANLTVANSEMKNELQNIKENLTISNANQDAKLDSIREKKGCPDGTFLFTPSNQCFRFLNDTKRTYDASKAACKALGLQMAHPYDAISLNHYLIQKSVPEFGHTWVGARGDGKYIRWESNGEAIRIYMPLWWPGRPSSYVDKGHCLIILTHDNYWKINPNLPYYNVGCTNKYWTLCEYVMG